MKKYYKMLIVLMFAAFIAGCGNVEKQKTAAEQRWDKNSAQIKLRVAQEQFESQQYDNALKLVNESIVIDDTIVDAYVLSGKIALAKSQFDVAYLNFAKAIEMDDNLDSVWYLLGWVAENQKDFAKADECYQKAFNINKDNIDYVAAITRVYVNQGDYDKGREFLEKNIKRHLDDVSLKITAANIEMQTGNYDKAINYYRQAVLLSGGDRNILESLGYCCIAVEQWTYAEDIFKSLADSADQNQKDECNKILTVCRMNSGKYAEAASDYDRISAEQRNDPQFWLKLGYAHLGNNSAIAALACSKRALKIDPAMMEALNLQAAAQYLTGNYKACASTCESIIRNESQSSFAWMLSGKCYEKLGNSDKASFAYEQSLKIKPGNQGVMKLAGNL
jgi:superkiller protein 3